RCRAASSRQRSAACGSQGSEMAKQSSIWKKEIRLGGSRKPSPPAPAAAPTSAKSSSFLKKEISFGRRGGKAKEARPVARPVAVPAPPLPEAPAGVRELLAPQVDATLA